MSAEQLLARGAQLRTRGDVTGELQRAGDEGVVLRQRIRGIERVHPAGDGAEELGVAHGGRVGGQAQEQGHAVARVANVDRLAFPQPDPVAVLLGDGVERAAASVPTTSSKVSDSGATVVGRARQRRRA